MAALKRNTLAEILELEAARLAGASEVLAAMDDNPAANALGLVRDALDRANHAISEVAAQLQR